MAFFVQRQLDFIQTTGEVFFRNIAELKSGSSDGVAQAGAGTACPAAGCRWPARRRDSAGTKGDVGIRRDWRGLRRQVQGHAFRHKSLQREIPFARLIVVPVLARMCHMPVVALLSSG